MTVSFESAKALLIDKSPCYSLDDVERVFGVAFSSAQRIALGAIPFTEKTLKACAGTHMLFPALRYSFLDIKARHPDLYLSNLDWGSWYEKDAFASIKVEPVWQLFRMEPLPGSLDKCWGDQKKLILSQEVEMSASAALVAFGTILHYQLAKHRLFEDCFVRTSNLRDDVERVSVGFPDDGFEVISDDWGRIPIKGLGLASVRKPDILF